MTRNDSPTREKGSHDKSAFDETQHVFSRKDVSFEIQLDESLDTIGYLQKFQICQIWNFLKLIFNQTENRLDEPKNALWPAAKKFFGPRIWTYTQVFANFFNIIQIIFLAEEFSATAWPRAVLILTPS